MGPLAGLRDRPDAVEVVVQRRYNPEGKSRLNIVPGLVGTILTMTMLIFTALSVTREIERVAELNDADLIVCGAEPLFFLDYYATGGLNVDEAAQVVEGIGEGCLQSGCSLIGGETAEMPGMYKKEDYDLAGFAVGIVEKDEIIENDLVKPGDKLIGMASSGPHSNGYSLVRKVLEVSGTSLSMDFGGKSIGEVLLTPTEIYVKAIQALKGHATVHALAHITGGGIVENLPRVLPDNAQAVINMSAWQRPEIFKWLQKQGNIKESEMVRTFNCGVGMIVCVPAQDCEKALAILNKHNKGAFELGYIRSADAGAAPVVLEGHVR